MKIFAELNPETDYIVIKEELTGIECRFLAKNANNHGIFFAAIKRLFAQLELMKKDPSRAQFSMREERFKCESILFTPGTSVEASLE